MTNFFKFYIKNQSKMTGFDLLFMSLSSMHSSIERTSWEDTLCQFSFFVLGGTWGIYSILEIRTIIASPDMIFLVNIVQVHNVQVNVLSTIFEVTIKDCYQVINLFVTSLPKSNVVYELSRYHQPRNQASRLARVQVLQPLTPLL